MADTLQFLTNRKVPAGALRQGMPLEDWPAVTTRRALTAKEREWLEMLPAGVNLTVEFLGITCPHERRFFVGRIEAALMGNRGSVAVEDGELVVYMGGGKHTICQDVRAGEMSPSRSDDPGSTARGCKGAADQSPAAVPVGKPGAAALSFLLRADPVDPAKVRDGAAVKVEPTRRRAVLTTGEQSNDLTGRIHGHRGCPQD